jgi:hypothetical protein
MSAGLKEVLALISSVQFGGVSRLELKPISQGLIPITKTKHRQKKNRILLSFLSFFWDPNVAVANSLYSNGYCILFV